MNKHAIQLPLFVSSKRHWLAELTSCKYTLRPCASSRFAEERGTMSINNL